MLTDDDWTDDQIVRVIVRVLDLYPAAQLRGLNVVGRE
jgi:hypothetical protein